MTTLSDRLASIEGRIVEACRRAERRRDEVTLIGVTKGHDAARIRALAELGVRDFGESYVQEWQRKADEVPDARWHFIGHLQSNKVRHLLGRVVLIHSVDRASLVTEIARRADGPTAVLLQINVGEDPAKSGANPRAALDLLQAATAHPQLRVRGLMTIPPLAEDPEATRPHFRALREIHDACARWLEAHAPQRRGEFTELSMGMSDDFEYAIEEGATMIRVGTALLGPRSYT